MSSTRPTIAKEDLEIIFEAEGEQGQEWVPGMTFYAYWRGDHQTAPLFPLEEWPDGCRVKPFRLFGPAWTIWLWDLAVEQWPRANDWLVLVETTLEAFTRVGARIAWCGTEGHFEDPPSLFSENMAEGVYAAYAEELGFICTPSLDQPLKTVSEEAMRRMKSLL